MKKLVASTLVAVCCIWLTGCPSSSSTSPKKETGTAKPGSPGGEHVLKVSTNHSSYTVKEGDSAEVKVSITREPSSWDEDVTVVFKDLPKGVTVTPAEGNIGKASKESTFSLTATADAPTVDNQGALVEARSGDKSATAPIKITVKKK